MRGDGILEREREGMWMREGGGGGCECVRG